MRVYKKARLATVSTSPPFARTENHVIYEFITTETKEFGIVEDVFLNGNVSTAFLLHTS
jgi:hypothetical protein